MKLAVFLKTGLRKGRELYNSRRLRALGMLWLCALVPAGCNNKKDQQGFVRPPAPVAVSEAQSRDVAVYIDGIGKIVAREVVSVQPQVSGRITAIHFTDGADVKAGDPLFTIDPRPFRAQLDAAEASLAQAKAVLDLAKINLTRITSLTDTKAVAKQDIDAKKNAVDVAEAQVKQNMATVDTARLNLDYCSIRSPINGRAGQRLVDIGNVVAANAGSLLVIERLDPIYVDFTIAESDLTTVQKNMATGSLSAEVRLPDDPANPRTGTLTFLDNSVQDTTGTVKLRATIPNKDRHFWPGRLVKVRLVLSTIKNAVLIPASAPQMSAKGSFVYVVKDDATADIRPVELGQRQGEMVVVSSGLKPGERVVVTGQLGVTPGGKVRVEESQNAEGSPKAATGGKS